MFNPHNGSAYGATLVCTVPEQPDWPVKFVPPTTKRSGVWSDAVPLVFTAWFDEEFT